MIILFYFYLILMDSVNIQGEEVDITEEQYSFSDEEEEENEVIKEQPNRKKGVVLHTIKSKLKIIKYEKEHSQKSFSIKFGIPPTTIHD